MDDYKRLLSLIMANDAIELEDIKQRIDSDFPYKRAEVFKLINIAVEKTSYLNHPRILRCILFLANGDMKKLNKNIDAAVNDPRDVMFWAEYINRGAESTPKKVRDFNKTFNSCEIGPRER